MARKRFQLTEEQVQELTTAYHQSKDGPTRSRYLAVRLYSGGYPTQEVLEIAGCSRTSLMGWCRRYRNQGTTGLVDKRAGGNNAKLSPLQIEELGQRLHTYTPRQVLGVATATEAGQFWTVDELQATVQRWYGVTYRSNSSYLSLFALCGFSYQRPAKVFKSRREVDVIAFQEHLEKNWSTSPRRHPGL